MLLASFSGSFGARLCFACFSPRSQIPTTVFTPMEYGAVGYSEDAAVAKFGKAAIKVYASRYGVLEGASVYKEHIPKPRSSLFIGKNLWARNFTLANGGSFEGECAAAPTQPPALPDVHGDPLHNAAQWARRKAQDRLRGRVEQTDARPDALRRASLRRVAHRLLALVRAAALFQTSSSTATRPRSNRASI